MMHQLASHYPLLITMLGSGMIGIIAGCIGVFALLKKQSLLGDTISHAALPGIVLALIINQHKDPVILLLGGSIAGSIGALLTLLIDYTTTLHKDSSLGIILSTFFGFGLLLISIMQKYPFAQQAIINKFLFGNASLLLASDIPIIMITGFICITGIIACWKELTLGAFDPVLAHCIHYSPAIITGLTTGFLVITIVIGLQTVGVILMSSLLIAPAASARQWTNKVSRMVIISSSIGGVAAMMGTYISILTNSASGPMIVVILSCIVVFSLVCASWHGLLRQHAKQLS